jgi:hypothetical protein
VTLGAAIQLDTTHGDLTMTGIERVEFTDALFALDTGVNQPAWQAEALLWAGFGVAPQRDMLSSWTHAADQLGSMHALADLMLGTYAPGIDTASLVRYLYGTLAHLSPSESDVQQWVDEVGPGKAFEDNAALLAFAASTDLNTDRMAGFTGSVQQLDPAFF